MKKIPQFIKFFIRGNIIILFSVFVVFTFVSFLYYYYHLKQDPMHYFGWWYGHIKSFRIAEYIYYLIALEIVLAAGGLWYVFSHKEYS
jgi:hypothetical protein